MDLNLHAIENVPIIKPGDDIADIICDLLSDIQDDDIFVIASTIISKAENNFFKLDGITAGPEAIRISKLNGKDPRFVQVVLDESLEVFIESPFMLVRTTRGNVCVNAGIDGSNVGDSVYITLPKNPEKAAKEIGLKIFEKTGKKVSIIVSDTNGRAFKVGQTNAAIGVYGISPIRDWVGSQDLFGKVLEASKQAIVDEIACAANILMGEGSYGYPIIRVRGLSLYTDEKVSINDLFRPEKDDIIIEGLRLLRGIED